MFRPKRSPVEIPPLSHVVAAAADLIMLRRNGEARKLRDRHMAVAHCTPQMWNAEVDRMISVIESRETEHESERHKVLAALRALYA
jgi:hypothetical protein